MADQEDREDTPSIGATESATAQATPTKSKNSRRGGTREQHIAAGRKGGQRVRKLIEAGRKYEEMHGPLE